MNGMMGEASEVRARRPGLMIMDDITEPVRKESWSVRFGRWLLRHQRPMISASAIAANERMEKAAMAEKAMTLHNPPTVMFRIVQAENGKIVIYTKPAENENRIGATMESYYLVKEGENLMDSIARCLAFDKLKP